MRPLKLLMRAFGPYHGEQEVDFTTFEEAPLFLVHGETGSGKSMLLDAICFALFGRASGPEREAGQLRSQQAEDATLTEVRLDFRLGGEHYRVIRRPTQRRRKKRGEGFTTEDAHAELWRRTPGMPEEEEGVLLAEKVGDVNAKVEDLLGLTAEQFRQVIVLPQGRFRDLLTASSTQRQEILQRLFDTEIYARLEAALKERARAGKERLERLRERNAALLQRHGLEEADDEVAKAALQERLSEIEKELEKTTSTLSENEEKLKYVSELLQAREAEETHTATLVQAQEALRMATETARQAETTLAEARRKAEKIHSLTAEEERLKAALKDATALAVLAKEVKEREEALTAARRAAEEAEAVAEKHATDLRVAGERLEAARERAAPEKALALELKQLQDALAQRAALEEAGRTVMQAQETLKERQAERKHAERALEEAERAVDAIQARLRQAHAVMLARTLEPGRPCPVCGSTEHPAPAGKEAGDAPGEAEIAAAEEALAQARAALEMTRQAETEAARAVSAAEARLQALRQTLALPDRTPEELAEKARAAERALEEARAAAAEAEKLERAVETLKFRQEELTRSLEERRASVSSAEHELARARGGLEQLLERVPEEMRSPEVVEARLRDVRGRRAALEETLRQAEERHGKAAEALAAAQARLHDAEKARAKAEAAAEKALRRYLEAGLPQEESMPERLRDRQAELRAAIEQLREVRGRLDERRKGLRDTLAALAELAQERAALEHEHALVHGLSALASGDNPARMTLQRYVLAALLDEVLAAANHRLRVMSQGRYELRRRALPGDLRRAGGLDLDVLDAWSGEARPVQTLSGGESFLAALALALGLADVVQAGAGGVRMETLFIDEGFGSLDAEALDHAIEALVNLRAKGRLIGIISHVPELRERIPAQLRVRKGRNGSSIEPVLP